MRRRVFVVAGEYSVNPRYLRPERRARAALEQPLPEPGDDEIANAFFRWPNRGEDGRARPDDWKRDFGLPAPIGIIDLFAAAGHRALTSLHQLAGGSYRDVCDAISALYVTSMPGLDPNERMNVGLVPQALRAMLGISPRALAQHMVATSDSGAVTFAQAVRAARGAERPATILVVAGQIIPSGYASQYQIRSVLGEADQARGIDMLAVGDILMDSQRRNLGLSRGEVESFLSRLAARKFKASAQYPAGFAAGKPFKREAPRTPWFDATDIASPCCGAAAVIVTSDEALAERLARGSQRFRAAPVTEVIGVGEGSSNENLIYRQAPLTVGTAVRDALSSTADDARVPLATYASCAFGVLHDAFPSIELSFLLGMGLSWERAAERMLDGWSNPFGGLLTFGHALGASGLVQVIKAHHLFSGDRRYAKDRPGGRRSGFREGGALAFTTSVGGPLSHVVATLLRGGFGEVREPVRNARAVDAEPAPLSTAWAASRKLLQRAVPAHLLRLRRELDADAWLVEGTTYVNLRSALHALSDADVGRLTFDGLEAFVAPAHLDEVRGQLRDLVRVVRGEAERVSTMFDVFRLLADEVRELASSWKSLGLLTAAGAALPDHKLADRVKECLRAPFALLRGPAVERAERRSVVFLPVGELTFASLAGVDVVARRADGSLAPLPSDGELLPFWNVRAARPERPPRAPNASAAELVDRLLSPREPAESAAELELLRAFFAPDPLPEVLRKALARAGGVAPEPARSARGVVYLGALDPAAAGGEAQALLGRAARDARGFLEAFETAFCHAPDALEVAAFEPAPYRNELDEALLSGARFAREVARAARENGLSVRAAVCAGEGTIFEDAAQQSSFASPATARAAALLAQLSPEAGVALAVEGASGLLLEQMKLRLTGWDLAPGGERGVAIFRART